MLFKMTKYKDKDFHLAIVKCLCQVKWSKNGVAHSFNFHAIIPAHHIFW